MSRRIAHRPRYRNMRQLVQPPLHPRQNFFRSRWTYRHQRPSYEKHPLGYRLSLIVPGYRFIHSVMLPIRA
jgi:hypothetical protein